MRTKVVLIFPPQVVNRPIIYRLVKDYDLIVNILRAEIAPEKGKMLLEIEGENEQISKGLKYLSDNKIELQPLIKDINLNEKECVSCGACTGICTPAALRLDAKTGKLIFEKEKCNLCGMCVNTCPLRCIKIEF